MIKQFLLTALSIIAFGAFGQNFQWAKHMGGGGGDNLGHSVVDHSGNVYTTGCFNYSADFDPGEGIFYLNPSIGFDIFVSKLDSSGNFVWAKRIGGTGEESGQDIALDESGNIYITGSFSHTCDFDPGLATFNLTTTGIDIFILKLNSSGDFVWAKQIGNTLYWNIGFSIDVDASGNVYTAGEFYGLVDFDPGLSSFYLSSNGWHDKFILKLNHFGNFVWAKHIDDNGMGGPIKIQTDTPGNVYVTGSFGGTLTINPDPGVFSLSSVGGTDIFVIKMAASGNIEWAKSFGGTSDDFAPSLAIDGSGSIYNAGYMGHDTAFISKLDSLGNLIWTKKINGASSVYAIALDDSINIFGIGRFQGLIDFDPGLAVYDLESDPAGSMFILEVDSNGNFIMVKGIGGVLTVACAISVDHIDNLYLTGSFYETVDFDPGNGIANLTSSGSSDIFVLKLGNVLPIGIEELNNKNGIVVYPNPTNDVIFIQISHSLLGTPFMIVDETGRQLVNGKLVDPVSKVDISLFAPGFYFIKLYGLENKTFKLVKR